MGTWPASREGQQEVTAPSPLRFAVPLPCMLFFVRFPYNLNTQRYALFNLAWIVSGPQHRRFTPRTCLYFSRGEVDRAHREITPLVQGDRRRG
jgi:hypothetical protein